MITIITPTYNRLATLGRLVKSLEEQTSRDFEWLIVDDGSEDGTSQFISSQADGSSVDCRYIYQKNSGKHVAINTGVSAAHGNWIFIVDSDDVPVPDAIAVLIDSIGSNVDSETVGLCYRKILLDGTLVGKKTTLDKPASLHPTLAASIFGGDLAYVFRTSALRRLPFPVVKGEKFVPELYIWNKLGDMGKIIYFPSDAIYRCEYRDDGYSANFKINLRRNPGGFLLFYRSQIARESKFQIKLKYMIRVFQCTAYLLINKVRI